MSFGNLEPIPPTKTLNQASFHCFFTQAFTSETKICSSLRVELETCKRKALFQSGLFLPKVSIPSKFETHKYRSAQRGSYFGARMSSLLRHTSNICNIQKVNAENGMYNTPKYIFPIKYKERNTCVMHLREGHCAIHLEQWMLPQQITRKRNQEN